MFVSKVHVLYTIIIHHENLHSIRESYTLDKARHILVSL